MKMKKRPDARKKGVSPKASAPNTQWAPERSTLSQRKGRGVAKWEDSQMKGFSSATPQEEWTLPRRGLQSVAAQEGEAAMTKSKLGKRWRSDTNEEGAMKRGSFLQVRGRTATCQITSRRGSLRLFCPLAWSGGIPD